METLGIEIIIIGVAYALLAVTVQRKLSNMKKMYETQDIIKQKSNELMELTKKGVTDKALLDAKQKEVMAMVSQSMKSQLKPMFVVFPLFLIVYYWALPAGIGPLAGTQTFTSFNLDYKTLFIVVTFIVGLSVSMVLMQLDKRSMKKEKLAQQSAPQQ
ncbi:MAG: DUF106 domain-containing protein [Candidatus Micrarchaeota archaeon]|nr:DUF106 domain-containing protein [Candidatus Micrarchaeota archaeon]